MDTWMKWLRSKLVMVMAAYWSAIILLTLALEWIDRHQVAFGIAVSIVGVIVAALLAIRWRNRRYW